MIGQLNNGILTEVTAFYVVKRGKVVAELNEVRSLTNGVYVTIWEATQNYWLNNKAWINNQVWKQ